MNFNVTQNSEKENVWQEFRPYKKAVFVLIKVYAFVCICMHLYAFVCICMHLYAFVCICMHLYRFVCICMYLYVFCMYVYEYNLAKKHVQITEEKTVSFNG